MSGQNKMDNNTLLLFTRAQKVKELSNLSRFIFYATSRVPQDPAFLNNLILPEEEIAKSDCDAIDDLYGEYPYLVHNDSYIARQNILNFCKEMTKINQKITLSLEDKNNIEQLEILLVNQLHLITKLTYHEAELDERNQLMFYFLHPFTAFSNLIEFGYLKKYATEIHNLHSKVHRIDQAKQIHEKLSFLLADKRTFFDQPQEEFKQGSYLNDDENPLFSQDFNGNNKLFEDRKEEEDEQDQDHQRQIQITSLDIVAYAYLKEELTNIPDSPQVIQMKESYQNLVEFVHKLDIFFASIKQGRVSVEKHNILRWNTDYETEKRLVNSFLQKSAFVNKAQNKQKKLSAKKGFGQEEKEREEKNQSQEQLQKKQEEIEKVRNVYISVIAGTIFYYLNFAPNPFKK
ncbi:UNKNOWN [Stylonychia lemnae]|uniref:Uncharacterized protein n=1 Tax=Stylonychia lemnae TaxID=5949 RepID=A0A078A9S4_STYLE|nr:UNKNOWN [Stylonychia lemnae]|eukprot:CDW78641.1 UNKNOWN [Stylonychia lemnae]